RQSAEPSALPVQRVEGLLPPERNGPEVVPYLGNCLLGALDRKTGVELLMDRLHRQPTVEGCKPKNVTRFQGAPPISWPRPVGSGWGLPCSSRRNQCVYRP